MRILTWNCQGAFAKKSHLVAMERPDVAIIQECSYTSMRNLPEGYLGLWLAGNEKRGIGLMYKSDLNFAKAADPEQSWVVPVDCSFEDQRLRLVAVWTVPAPNSRSYVEQFRSCLQDRPEWFTANTVIAGDFNSNQRFDKSNRPEHSRMISELDACGFVSAYHSTFSEEHGSESQATYYHCRNAEKPFHLDYIFLPKEWTTRLSMLSIGARDFWRRHSDHCPIMITLA